jgi:hypothetical protein
MARGWLTTTGTSTTLTFLLRANAGNNSSYTTLVTHGGITTGTTVLTTVQWKLETISRCTAIASTGNTVSTQGEISIRGIIPTTPSLVGSPQALTGAASVVADLAMPNINGETAAQVDTTRFTGIGLAATLAGANASVQLTQWIVEQLD